MVHHSGFCTYRKDTQIAVKSGPIDPVYGLAKVVATTAGGTVTIHFLEQEVAEEIAIVSAYGTLYSQAARD